LEEAFGGLITRERLGYDDVMKHLSLKSTEIPFFIGEINEYLKEADHESRESEALVH
jgi:hypothetical protein